MPGPLTHRFIHRMSLRETLGLIVAALADAEVPHMIAGSTDASMRPSRLLAPR